MITRKMILRFPPDLVEEPVTYRLVKEHGLTVNILRASIQPGRTGRLAMAISGEEEDLDRAMTYMKDLGLGLEPMAEEVRQYEDRCVSCTACIPACPTHALDVDRTTWQVSLDKDKCILCGSCVVVCPYRAMEIAYNGW